MAAEIDQQLLQLAKYLEAEKFKYDDSTGADDTEERAYYEGRRDAYHETLNKVRKILLAHAAINRKFARHIEEHLMREPRRGVGEQVG